jgi:diketogulonate reductase-like aldo/keto reductase
MDLGRVGLGTWEMGDDPARRAEEVRALRRGIDLGVTTIDTAEMYGSGRAESLVGEAIRGRRDDVFLVTKVLPENASEAGVVAACERSLARLGTDRVDLYLLHWPGRHPIAATVAGFERLVAQGKARRWGVSNLDVDDLEEMRAVPGGDRCAANQVYYNLAHRVAERRVLPWCRAHGATMQAYTPLDQGRLVRDRAVRAVAERRGVAPATVAIAWTVREEGTATVAKTARADRVDEVAAAATFRLAPEDLRDLDAAHPPPTRDRRLETI